MNPRDEAALCEIVRLRDLAADLVARGRDWYEGNPDNVPGVAAESLIIKIGENVARLRSDTVAQHPQVPWSLIKRMRDLLAHHYGGTDYATVWSTLTVDMPTIRAYIAAVMWAFDGALGLHRSWQVIVPVGSLQVRQRHPQPPDQLLLLMPPTMADPWSGRWEFRGSSFIS